MATPARLAANRQNALLSTGPRTPEGKAVACQNARTHGLLSRQVLLPDENKARLLALREQFLAELAPVGELETLLVERMIACAWRLRRLHRVERPCSKPSGGSSSRAIPPTRWSRPGHSAARWRRSTKARSSGSWKRPVAPGSRFRSSSP